MIYDYFHYTELDRKYYDEHLRNRLPQVILDSHGHLNTWDHLKDIPPERIASDWALQYGMHMTAEDLAYYYGLFFPDKNIRSVSFPFPIKEANIEDNNDYVARCAGEGKIAYGVMCTKPEYSCEYLEQQVRTKGFSGFKPYPDMVSGEKGAEISIFQFITHDQLALAERLQLPIVMHLPRAGRMPDPNNIHELREIRQKYPNLKMVIAHFGRCFTPYYFNLALERLGEDAKGFLFDTAAVLNPEVLRMGFDRLSPEQILFGMDQPIFLWHGYREWTDTKYVNIAREDFSWNVNRKDPATEAGYTLFIYRQLDNILNELDRFAASPEVRDAIFRGNCARVFGGQK